MPTELEALAAELQTLVRPYSSFDEATKSYNPVPDKKPLSDLNFRFAAWVNHKLTQNTAGSSFDRELRHNLKKLMMLFHPDRQKYFLPEVVWLNCQLDEGKTDACFRVIQSCFIKLSQGPQELNSLEHIQTSEEYRAWLEQLIINTANPSKRNFYINLRQLLDEFLRLTKSTKQVKPQSIQRLILSLPFTLAGYGALLIGEELLVVSALYLLMLKGGQYIQISTDTREIKWVGSEMEQAGLTCALTTSSFLVSSMELLLWGSRMCVDSSAQVIQSMPAIPAFSPKNSPPQYKYKSKALETIAIPLRNYVNSLQKQHFLDMRWGGSKNNIFKGLLYHLQALDTSYAESKELDSLKALKKSVDAIEKLLKEALSDPQTSATSLKGRSNAVFAIRSALAMTASRKRELESASEKQLIIFSPLNP